MRILIVGCGYLGREVARGWVKSHSVFALTRSPHHAEELQRLGIEPILGDVMNPAALTALPEVDLCLYAVGFDRTATHDKRSVYVDGLRNVLSTRRFRRLIHISSTSVYGQDASETVNEDSPCEPTSEGGEICLDAERVVRKFFPITQSPTNANVTFDAVILRLSGIYGLGRLIGRLDQLRQGQPQRGNPEAWLNLIHVADAAQVIQHIAETPPPSPLYLVSDARPLRRREFYAALAEQIGAPAPSFPDAGDHSLNKRCDSSRVRRELGMTLIWPDAIAALPSLLAN